MTSKLSLEQLKQTMGAIGLKEFASLTIGKQNVTMLVNPRTRFALSVWQREDTVAGVFSQEDWASLRREMLKTYLRQGIRISVAHDKVEEKLKGFFGAFYEAPQASH